jgi:hypothetical protein
VSENVVLLIANIIVIFAWVGTALFVGFYAAKSRWRATISGRTLMYAKIAMLALLTYALVARWFLRDLPDLNYSLALASYLFIALMQWRLFLVLRFIQTGKVTPEHPNYTPFRDLARRIKKRLGR